MQQFGLDQISVNNPENRLRAEPSAPDTTAECCQKKDKKETENKQKRHHIEFLHIENTEEEMNLLVVEV